MATGDVLRAQAASLLEAQAAVQAQGAALAKERSQHEQLMQVRAVWMCTRRHGYVQAGWVCTGKHGCVQCNLDVHSAD